MIYKNKEFLYQNYSNKIKTLLRYKTSLVTQYLQKKSQKIKLPWKPQTYKPKTM